MRLLPTNLLRMKFDLYLNEFERTVIETLAGEVHLSMSSFIRKSALGQTIIAPPAPVTAQQWAALGQAIGDLNRLIRANDARFGVDEVAALRNLSKEIAAVRLLLVSNGGVHDR